MHLVDHLLHHQQDVRASPGYTFSGGLDGVTDRFELIIGTSGAVSDDIAELREIPESIQIHTFPNPFSTYTTLQFGLPESQPVTIDVYDVLGKKIVTLIESDSRGAGTHAVQWDGRDNTGRPVANGIYLVAMHTGSERIVRQVVVLR